MGLGNWLGYRRARNKSRRVRMRQAASRDRQRIILRPWSFELLEDRSLLAGLSGLHNIGPTGDFTSITAAIASMQTNGLDGAVTLELQPTYVSTVEVFPIVFANINTTSVNTLTLRPQADAVNRSISSADTTAATIDLNGSQYVTIDGRPGGTGSISQLRISNTNINGIALRFINDASNNIVRHTILRGVNTSTNSGVVVFGSTTGVRGNDNNMIDSSDIRDNASTPANGIFSLGNQETMEQNNSNNTVSNSNIFNFYSSSFDAAGIRLDAGNTDWKITGNSFYQTTSRIAVSANVRAVYVNNSEGNNFNITDNFIGGDSPGGLVTTRRWLTTGFTANYQFVGIQLNVGSTAWSSIQGNTIRSILWTSSSSASTLPGIWSGVYVSAGSVNIGTTEGNIIGSDVGSGSITVNSAGSGGYAFGIGSTSAENVIISNNVVGSMTARGPNNSYAVSIVGIYVTTGTNIISNNTIGSSTTANSLFANSSSTLNVAQEVTGIFSSSDKTVQIADNQVSNLSNNYVDGTASRGGKTQGIVAYTSAASSITRNAISNLSTTSQKGDAFFSNASVMGIFLSSPAKGQVISQNVVHSLSNTAAISNTIVIGIYYRGQIYSEAQISRNFVHSIESPGEVAGLVGLFFEQSYVTGIYKKVNISAVNNMVRLGIDSSGASTGSKSEIFGIIVHDKASTGSVQQFYHNSIYVGGMHTSNLSTIAFSTDSTYHQDLRNNIFVNARSNISGSGKHYALQRNAPIVNPPFTSDYNIFSASGIGGNLGKYNGADVSSLAAWQSATGLDTLSAAVDPLFVNATGTAANVDLHLQVNSPAESAGFALTTVTDDFDGQSRNDLRVVDIGADELDLTSPSILGIFASGSTWSGAFIDAVDGDGIGAGNGLGYRLTPGLTLPNAGIDRIYLQFSEPVIGFDASSVALLGVNVANYATVSGLMSVSYDSVNRRGIIQLASGLTKDKLRIGVSDAVKDLSMNALDGDANASAGGVFDLRFNVLVGDANSDGSVNGGDLPAFALAFNKSIGSVSYNSLADWNSDGSVNGGDLPLFAARFNQSLHTAEPAALDFPPVLLPPLDSESMLAPPLEEIEEVFRQLDDDDELLEV